MSSTQTGGANLSLILPAIKFYERASSLGPNCSYLSKLAVPLCLCVCKAKQRVHKTMICDVSNEVAGNSLRVQKFDIQNAACCQLIASSQSRMHLDRNN
jgi:hypothetical protein